MEFLKWSLSAAILIVAIVVIRSLAISKLPKKTFIILWGVALCRLLVPFSLSSPFSIYTLVNNLQLVSMGTYISIAPNTITDLPEIGIATMTANSNSAGTSPGFLPVSVLTMMWLIGMLLCALYFVVLHLRCRSEYKSALPIDSEYISAWLYAHPIKRRVQILQSDKISAPLTYGIVKPIILLPKMIDWGNETQLRYVLKHEYVHIQRFDILTKYALAAALCVHWFNPLAWVMYVLANRDIELSCDEKVVRSFGETSKCAYALALIGLEEKRSRLAPLCNNFSKNAIEERIVSIMKIKKSSVMGIIIGLVIVVGITVAFATTAGSSGVASLRDQNPRVLTEEEKAANEYYNAANRQKVAEALKEYEAFGLTYDTNVIDGSGRGQLYFNGEPVCYFADNIATNGKFEGGAYNSGEGTSGVITERNTAGELMGLKLLNETELVGYKWYKK